MGGMPLPHWLTRANLVVLNRLTAPFAARLPGLGVLEHVGRRSRTVRRSPVAAFRRGPRRYVIALWYGPDAQWVHNVIAAGACRVRTRGRWIRLTDPRRFRDPARRDIPWAIRPLASLLRVDEFLEMRVTDTGGVAATGT
jgi:deazaflavin-dependent oxidoreductase (nitroreductase family)